MPKKEEIQLSDTGLDNKEIERSLWIARHRKELRLIGLVALILTTVLCVALLVLQLVRWISDIPLQNQIAAELSQQTVNYNAAQRPQPLTVGTATAVRYDENTIDLAVQITNTNPFWGANEATVTVFVGGQSAGSETVSFAPGQSRILAKVGLPNSSDTLPAVRATIEDVDWEAYRGDHTYPQADWSFNNAQVRRIPGGDDAGLRSELTFDIQNRSVLGFRRPEVVVLMRSSDTTVLAIGRLTLDSVGSLETRPVSFRWPVGLPSSLQPEIIINTDLLSEEQIIR